MQLPEYYQRGRFGLSFELFPPKTPAGQDALLSHVRRLAEFSPDYITCTYGAGGSTRDKTLQIVSRVKAEFGIAVASHLTCVAATVEQLRDYLQQARRQQVDYIVALRGDPPQGSTEFVAVDGGLRYANELVALIRREYSEFGVAVAGYPEVHQEAPNAEEDLRNLKRKVDSGADIIITQLFYQNGDFFRFQDRCRSLGITVPIVPGILPVTNLGQIQRITTLCKASLPRDFVARLGQHDDEQWQMQVGIEQATEQVRRLIEGGVSGVHFYVLNKSQATSAVLDNLQIKRAGH
ncbi:MAG: methylenetetrahydrofolate reductase [NAD(P)H] [Pirellulaceae bacterium]|nr:methylenetetrahydrofolate reductase [NAD(P)H] [Planctomycetales bacterium]